MHQVTTTTEGLSPIEAAVLPVIRHHVSALQGDTPLAWRLAFGIAEQRWGEGRGLAIAHRCQVFLSALIASRRLPLSTHDPFDIDMRDSLTEDEQTIISILSAMRVDDTPSARQKLAALVDGPLSSTTVQAGLSLALSLGTDHHTIRRPSAPKLRAVS